MKDLVYVGTNCLGDEYTVVYSLPKVVETLLSLPDWDQEIDPDWYDDGFDLSGRDLLADAARLTGLTEPDEDLALANPDRLIEVFGALDRMTIHERFPIMVF